MERPMSKKKAETPKPSEFVTVKISRAEHTKLRLVAASQGRDMAEVLTDLVRGPLDKLWKSEVARQSEEAKGGN